MIDSGPLLVGGVFDIGALLRNPLEVLLAALLCRLLRALQLTPAR